MRWINKQSCWGLRRVWGGASGLFNYPSSEKLIHSYIWECIKTEGKYHLGNSLYPIVHPFVPSYCIMLMISLLIFVYHIYSVCWNSVHILICWYCCFSSPHFLCSDYNVNTLEWYTTMPQILIKINISFMLKSIITNEFLSLLLQ